MVRQYFTETGESFNEAMDKIYSKYGKSIQIMGHRTKVHGGFLGFFQKEEIEVSGFVNPEWQVHEKSKLEEEKKKILQAAREKPQEKPVEREEKKDERITAVLEEVIALKKQLEELPDRLPQKDSSKEFSEPLGLQKARAILEDNDFSSAIIKELLDRLKKTLTMDELSNETLLEQQLLSWIAEKIKIWNGKKQIKPRIFILVGPTGVGKTTTIGKLAAIYGLGLAGREKHKVSLITIDNYRVGAKIQIESYGQIMSIPVSYIETYEALQQRIELDDDKDLILVDTIGKSPKDFVKLAEMRKLLEACGKISEVHLAVSATTKTKDIREIFQQFEPFGYQSVVITKLDETSVVGNLISLLAEKDKSVSFFTDGQSVPQNIYDAHPKVLLKRLVGFAPENIKSVVKE